MIKGQGSCQKALAVYDPVGRNLPCPSLIQCIAYLPGIPGPAAEKGDLSVARHTSLGHCPAHNSHTFIEIHGDHLDKYIKGGLFVSQEAPEEFPMKQKIQASLKAWIPVLQKKGVEPSRYCYHTDLNRARLPIPPLLRFLIVLTISAGDGT